MSCEICASGTELSKIAKARKDYVCCECQRPIVKGSAYWYFKACWPSMNGWANYKTCLKCKKIRNLAENKYQESWQEEYAGFGELYYWIKCQKGLL